MIPLVDQLLAAGVTLKKGECYSFKQPPVLGGDYTVENTCVLPIADFQRMHLTLCPDLDERNGASEIFNEIAIFLCQTRLTGMRPRPNC
jgi:Domain of unknown function (DUF1851)